MVGRYPNVFDHEGDWGFSVTFAPGSLVRARGRDWVVLPESADDLVVVRPLGGGDDEIATILTALTGMTSPAPAPIW